MSTLYYGDGVCSIEGSNIRFVIISYTGAIEIDDKTPEGYYITASIQRIIISPIRNISTPLNDLFKYVGELKISRAVAYNKNSEKTICTIKRVMDYSELIESNAEDLTVKSEDLSVGHKRARTIPRTILKQKTINNLHTGKIRLFDKNKEEYKGACHFDIETAKMMTGAVPSKDSAYIKTISDPETVRRVLAQDRMLRRLSWHKQ